MENLLLIIILQDIRLKYGQRSQALRLKDFALLPCKSLLLSIRVLKFERSTALFFVELVPRLLLVNN